MTDGPVPWRLLVAGRSIGLGALSGAALGGALGIFLIFPAGTVAVVPVGIAVGALLTVHAP